MVERQRRGWNERFGTVTRSFDEWRMTNSDIRAFLALTTRWMDERYQQVWNELGEQPAWDGCPDLPDLFYHAVDGLEPLDYHWMLQAAVVSDAVSAFEVYLEKAGDVVLRSHGYTWKVKLGRTPAWPDMVTFFSGQLQVEVNTNRVQHIRNLRHTLTHLLRRTALAAAARTVRPERRQRFPELPC